jgi:spore coat protein CotF
MDGLMPIQTRFKEMKTPVKFGAHEVLEVSEILTEKMCMINHLALYEQEAQDEQLRSMIRRQMDAAIQAYDQMVAYTHDFSARQGMQQPYPQPDANLERLKYGLRNPQQVVPQRTGRFNDMMIQTSLLTMHKMSAVSHIHRGAEVADPSLRQMFLNGAIACYNQAYEVFLYMNQQGMYQMPTLQETTAKTLLNTYQPMGQGGMMQGEMGHGGMMQGEMGHGGMMQGEMGHGGMMQGDMASMGQMTGQQMRAGSYPGTGRTGSAMHTGAMNGHYMNQ